MQSRHTLWLFTLAIGLSLGCTYADDGEERALERQLEHGIKAAWVSGPRLLDFAKPMTYSGLFVYGFETADFIPDGTSEHWWVWPSESSDLRARASNGRRAFRRWGRRESESSGGGCGLPIGGPRIAGPVGRGLPIQKLREDFSSP